MPQSIAIKDALNQAYRKQKVRKSELGGKFDHKNIQDATYA